MMRRLAGFVLATSLVTAFSGSVAAAGEWTAPNHAQSVLNPAYVPAPGHGDSISAICKGTDAIEVGIHPWDDVARSLQVFAADGSMLLNIASGHQFATIPLTDQPTRLVYNGDTEHPFALVTERCAVPVVVTVPSPTTTSWADVSLPPSKVTREEPVPVTVDGDTLGVAGVYAERQPIALPTRSLAATGGVEGFLLAAVALVVGIPLTIVTHRVHKRGQR